MAQFRKFQSLADGRKIPQIFRAVDVFSGAGGLSWGAKKAGFAIEAAIELNQAAANTYKANHPDVRLFVSDVRQVNGSHLVTSDLGAKLDLLMGCAPCQGFCSLTAKSGGGDKRNDLIHELSRLAAETEPDVILMENVPGLALRGAALFKEFQDELRQLGYMPKWWNVQMADYGVPQRRRRLVLLAGKGFELELPPPTHARSVAADSLLKPWRTVRQAIYGQPSPVSLSAALKKGGPVAANWHVVRDLKADTRARLTAALPGESRLEIAEELLPECHRRGYDGFRNIYTRLNWDEPSSTITSGCTTPAKGRFGHPNRRRTTISVREAATLQTFPASFRFATDKMEAVCQMIGNAVPPLFARKLVSHVLKILKKRREQV